MRTLIGNSKNRVKRKLKTKQTMNSKQVMYKKDIKDQISPLLFVEDIYNKLIISIEHMKENDIFSVV